MRFSSKIALGLGLLVLVGAGCSRPGYVVDFFPEMHYQQSFRSQEPQRLYPPAQSVPVTGKETPYTLSEAASLQNPLMASPQVKEQGARLFRINCAACHGAQGKGDSLVAILFTQAKVAPPADLTSPGIRALPSGVLFWMLTNGVGLMPPFGNLLPPEERWTLVLWVQGL